ncbi:MAG: hypothetical protein QOF89_3625 [Acidobacteriota bacterium]|jgi:hypothetical protein|nr:hypothetical protein [Acidobacteriota bacterium]
MIPAENWQTAAEAPAVEPQAPILPAAVPPPAVVRKNPILAMVLSLFPGMGNVYNGLYLRGMTFFLVIASLIGVVSRRHHGEELFVFAIFFFWLFNVIDAYRQATLINYGYAQDLGLTDLPRHPRASQGGLAAGILLTLIGLFALADRYLDIRLDWIFDLWPFALVAGGLWLIWSTIRDRRRAAG